MFRGRNDKERSHPVGILDEPISFQEGRERGRRAQWLKPGQAEQGAQDGADPICPSTVPRARRFSSGGEEDDFDRSMHKVSKPHH